MSISIEDITYKGYGMRKIRSIILGCLFIVIALCEFCIKPLCAKVGLSEEERLGERAARDVEERYKVVEDEEKTSLISKIGNALASASGRPYLHYHFKILDVKEPNAFAIPGGYVYVTRGLINFVQSEDELAGVLAHEVSHIVFKHSLKQVADNSKLNICTVLAAILAKEPDLAVLGSLISITVLNQYSRKYEREADLNAIRLTRAIGFNSLGLFTFLERLAIKEASRYSVDPGIFQDHPSIQERLIYTREMLMKEGVEIDRRATTHYLRLGTKDGRKDSLWAKTIYLDKREILTLVSKDKESLEERVGKIVENLDRLLRAEIESSEIKVIGMGKDAQLFVRDGEVLTINSEEASLLGKTPLQMAEAMADGIKKALWDLRVKFTFIGGFM
jgi:Zn-dependent protease with chaperone function